MAGFEVIFMDAGQGDCTLIVYPDNTVTLVDCGSTKSGAEAFREIKKVAHDRLEKSGSYANLVLTHPDEDHYNLIHKLDKNDRLISNLIYAYYGGHIDLYQNGREKDYTWELLNHLKDHDMAGPPKNTSSINPSSRLSRAGVNVTILAANCTGSPSAISSKGKNSNSIVLLVEYKGAKIFLMGDAFTQTEQFIMQTFTRAGQLSRLQKQPGEHVILKMGHHGSDTSSHEAWIRLIQPDIIVVSSGTKPFNGKGMPTTTKIDNARGWTTLTTTDINQSYVVFDESKRGMRGQDFVTRPKTKQAIWATCYEVAWAQNQRWFESGQTWYYGVEDDGTKKGDHWQGYTGYDDTQ